MPDDKIIDGVFEGGGVKGIGLVGALSVVESQGYRWGHVAGTSAGAIVASLVAAGYQASELKEIVGTLDYNRFKDPAVLSRIPLIGPLLNLAFTNGIYKGDEVYHWIEEKLAAKNIKVFGDLKSSEHAKGPEDLQRYRLHVITSDISQERLVVLPTACRLYGMDPDKLSVAQAVRMSMSIPFFFMPVEWQKSQFVDGGLLSNFPVWLFDDHKPSMRETFGIKFIEPEEGRPNNVRWISDFAKALITTMMEAHDKMHVEEEDFLRTIPIPTLGVKATDFGLTAQARDALFASGEKAAQEFFKRWTPTTVYTLAMHRRSPGYQRKIKMLKSLTRY